MKTRSATILPAIITSLVALTSVSHALAQGGNWTSIASMPVTPANLATASGAAFGGKFYVIDSGSGYGVPLPIKVYDPVTDSWSLKAADPVLRGQTAVGVMNNKIYVAEGWDGQFGSDSNAPTKVLEIYDPATDSWASGTSSLIARGLSATAVIGGKLYVAGGTAAGYANFADLEIYDPGTNTWSTGASLPNQLTSAGGAAFNGKFYVVGGYVGPSAYNNQITAAVQIYDPVLNTWSTGTPMPTARANMVVGVISGKLCVTSGNVADGSKDGSMVVYDSTTDSWSTAPAEPTGRANAAAVVLGNKLFVAGGNTDNTTGTSTAEAFSPEAAAHNVLAKIPIPASSGGGKVAVNPALNLVYTASGLLSGGTLTVIDGHTLTVVTTISDGGNSLQGVSVDLKNDNFWTTNLYGGQVLTFSGANTQIFANTVGYCPIETTFDCKLRRMWSGAQCGPGDDPVFAFNADTFALIAGPISTGGVMGETLANPVTGKLYVTASGISKEVDPTTFAVTTTGFGIVEAIDSVMNRLFAAQGSSLQIVDGANDTVMKTVTIGYTPGDMAVNNALGHVYLTNSAGNAIEARSEQGVLLGTFSLGTGNQPTQIAADSIRGRVYVKVVDGSGSWSVWAIEDLTSARACMRPGGP